MTRLIFKMMFVLLLLPAASSVFGQAESWPRTIALGPGTVTIYAPQVDEFDEETIRFRAALAYREKQGSEPVFGAGWFESPVTTDRAAETVRPMGLEVSQVRFPSGTGDIRESLARTMDSESAAGNLDFSLDEIRSSLDRTAAESQALEQLNTDPPKIIYKDHPALLVSMDGEPVIRDIENSPYRAVINTPYPLISDGKHYYLNVAKDVWYRAREATGPYRLETRPPAGIAALVDDEENSIEQAVNDISAANAPEIVVSTEPAELLVTEGPAAFVPLVDDLLVLQNSDDDVFMHVSEQKFYIVLAGRWYESATLSGPWTYRQADQLPAAFANIPEDSSQADSRVYVAGTDEAREAVLDAQVPQTAAVQRGEVDIDVQYDGEPSFEEVDGAELDYASNTGSTVILANGMYYLVEDGVWYISSTPNGPWQVSDHRPPQVVSIQPTSPVYNVRYVYVYDSTPDVVYVGYTPGYVGSYVYHNTLFYGSGWRYAPWVSPYYYYPRHATWGFNVSYNSWSGWNFGLSWGWGPFSFSYYTGGYWHHHHHWHHRHYGRWGPGRYRPRPYHRGPYRHHRPRAEHYAHRNLYRDGRQRARVADTRDVIPRRVDQKGRNYDKHSYRSGKYAETGQVKRQSIKTKADVRDANARASRKQLWADNDDMARRSPVKTARKQDTIRQGYPSVKSRSKPVTSSKSLVSNQKRSPANAITKQPASREKSAMYRQKSRTVSKPVQQRSGKLASARVQKQNRQKTVQPVSRKQPSRNWSQSKMVQGQSKPQVAQRQSSKRSVQKQSRPVSVKQAPQKNSGKSFAVRQGSKSSGGSRVKPGSRRQRGSRQ
jgi:hypothetical protein